MNRFVAGAVCALAVVGMAGGALAQATVKTPSAAVTAAPSAHQKELARQLIEATGARQNVAAMTRSMMQPMFAQMMARLPEDKKSLGPAIQESVVATLDKATPKIIEITVDIYASTFTEAELTQILAFMESPAGRSMNAKMPLMMSKMGEATAKLMPQVMQDMVGEMCSRIDCTADMKAAASGA